MSDIPVIDYIFAGLILLMVVHGYIKGFIAELFSWAAMILAIWAAVLLNTTGAAFIRERFMQNVRVVPEILALVAVFVLVMIVAKILEQVLKEVVSGANLGFLDRILGAVFGLVEGLAFTVLIIFVLRSIRPIIDTSGLLGESIFARYLLFIIGNRAERGQEVINAVLLLLPPSAGLSA